MCNARESRGESLSKMASAVANILLYIFTAELITAIFRT